MGQAKEEVALVLVAVAAAKESKLPVASAFQTGVVTGRDMGRVEAASNLGQIAELHSTIAAHAGDRRASRLVFGDEWVHHMLAKRRALIEDVVGNAEVLAGATRVVSILGSTASTDLGLAVRIPEMKGYADQLVSGFMQERRGHRGVHPAAHRYQHSLHFTHRSPILNKSTVVCYT